MAKLNDSTLQICCRNQFKEFSTPMFRLPTEYDVIVVGSGHAGIEAALAATRVGCRTLMLTQNLDTVGQMSCNPAIGGLAKGQIVREIDALGGAMGLNADATGIQFRMLNRSKGLAVRAPRVQCDKKAYQFRLKAILEGTANLDLKQATVSRVLVESGTVVGVETDFGVIVRGRSIVITSGTFLRGLVHVGGSSRPGGRMVDAVSSLSGCLQELGLEIGRFKTGTPCRLNAASIDFSKCTIQQGDEPPPRFSFVADPGYSSNGLFTLNELSTETFHVEQLPCWITTTTAETHQIIRANLDKSPLYAGRITGTGPRYCPSIEDKVVRFADRTAHQIFLEPEGRHTAEFYVNGISTSLPYGVQLRFVRSIPALERAEIMRPGYAVEYDFFPPTQLFHTLETKLVRNLFFAGQINGTSGYEEAAAQGLIAGINAALATQNKPSFTLDRNEAYIGVLIDDLVTKGTDEPYRMFTSRAEDRLELRHDNADQRLTAKAFPIGLISEMRWKAFRAKISQIDQCRALVHAKAVEGIRVSQLLKRPQFTYHQLPADLRSAIPDEVWESVEADIKYEGYTARQSQRNNELSGRCSQRIPVGIDFSCVTGLSSETKQKLSKIRPTTLGQAARISGVTPADISILSIWLTKNALDISAAA
jgi:tRNA uridine 5-carboxymethylaminomethyl modification enzyme